MAVSSKDFGNSSSNSSNSVPVILRIKRRRCEDPADALGNLDCTLICKS